MAKNTTEKGEIIKRYLSLKKYNKLPDKTVSDIIYNENKTIFPSKEASRNLVRYYRGHIGDVNRKKVNKEYVKPLTYDTRNYKPFKEEEVYAKILILDIETAPLLANIWGIWNQNINLDNIHSDWFMLTWAAKWLFEKKVYSAKVTPTEAIKQDDKRIVKSLISLLNKADIVVTHNGDRFDLPRINTRALIHKIERPLPYQSIDTLKVAKRKFAFTSNKLDYINQQLGLPKKTETGMQLWRDCFVGKKAGLLNMETYNINDVRIHEETYLRMRSWITPHPNIGLFIIDEHEHCPSCGSKELKMQGKYYATSMNVYETFRCINCGGVGKKRKASAKSRNLTSSVPR